ncbi:MAG: nucleoside recognition protein [Clostridia bacterium]|nr:nucleoside recognition protein [Clostridia bacterium]
MIGFSIIVGVFSGKIQEMTTCIFDSSKSAIETCISVFGIICLWSGFMNIAEKSGLLRKAEKIAYPMIKILFPELNRKSPAVGSIAMNMTANMIGLGNIATPMGIRAMEELQKENKNKSKLSKSMMTLLVLNMSSIQLIPTTVIALRASYGSENPAEIVLPVLIASFTAVISGIILVRIFGRED